MIKKLALIILFLNLCAAFAAHKAPEKDYQNRFSKTLDNAKTEVVAPDKTRCDILTDEYAIEVDFANKWAEAIGQSLNYAMQFNKKAGILLILESPKDYKYYVRLNSIIKHFKLPISVWKIGE